MKLSYNDKLKMYIVTDFDTKTNRLVIVDKDKDLYALGMRQGFFTKDESDMEEEDEE